jgi:beta-ribofuranosylaminobenzene 5'-phosphate synthase
VRSGGEQAAPLLARYAMPDDWHCVLAIPTADPGLSGPAEEEAFARLRPDPTRAALIAQLVLTALLPGLADRDLCEFGAALTRLQQLVGETFAPAQGGVFHPRAGGLVEAMLRLGAAGVGQSSWGPAVYGIVGGEDVGRELVSRMTTELAGRGRVELVRFDNRGARVEVR